MPRAKKPVDSSSPRTALDAAHRAAPTPRRRATRAPGTRKAQAVEPTPAPSAEVGGRPRQRITITSVAEAAGVSIATVSFVLNKRSGQVISQPVRERVLEAAKRLNYAPSAAAAGLARKHTANVAICFYRNAHLTNPLYSFVIQGAIKEAILREFNVLFSFMNDEYKDYDDLPKVVREKNAEGALFIHDVSEPLFRELESRGIRAVAVDSHPTISGLDAIYADNEQGGRLACQHLAELGHRHVALLYASPDRPSIEARARGFADELQKLNLPVDPAGPFVEAAALSFQAGYERALLAFKERPELTGIACANDDLAAGVLRAASESGRSVPGDLSVLGFDDIRMARCLTPALSTIAYDREAMGRLAMARLIDQVEGKPEGSPLARVPVQLVQRASTGQVRGR